MKVLRERSGDASPRVTHTEPFFDLVHLFAITHRHAESGAAATSGDAAAAARAERRIPMRTPSWSRG